MKGRANPKLGKCSLAEFYEITCFNEWSVLLKHHKIDTTGWLIQLVNNQASVSRENVKKKISV